MSARRAPTGRATGWTPSSDFFLPRPQWLADAPSPLARRSLWQGLVTAGGFGLTGFPLYVAAVMLSTGRAG